MDSKAPTGTWFDKRELRRLLSLMVPLYIANLMNMGMGVVDTIVAGRAGAEQLAGVAMGCAVTAPIMVSIGSILTIIGPMVSRLRGAGCEGKVGYLLNNAHRLGWLLVVVEMLVLWCAGLVFPYVSDNAEMVRVAQLYLYFLIPAAPASVFMRGLQGNFEGYGQTRPAMLISFVGLLLNIPLNFLFVFGWGCIPALGGAGCGLATTFIHWLMCGVLLALMYALPQHRLHARQMLTWRPVDWALVRKIVGMGLPLGVASLCEMSFFCVVTLVIAPLGALAVSAQQVAINVSALVFMFPLSLSVAVSIRAAYHVGAGNRRGFYAMLGTGAGLMYCVVTLLALGTILFRQDIIALYTEDAAIAEVAQFLLVLCALYQYSDCTQCFMAGLLRGLHDTKVITWACMISYWLVGFPLACILIRTDWLLPAMGPAGAWVSFVVALTVAAVLLSLRFNRSRKRVFPPL